MPFLSAEIMQGLASARPAASSGGRTYYATDAGKIYWDSGTSWIDVTPPGVVLSVAGRTGAVVLAESDITGLVADLAAKAALASPTFTGTPAGPTAATGTNTTQLATTAFVQAQIAVASQPFLITYSLAGAPAASDTLYIDIPSNLTTVAFAANFAGSTGKCGTNPTASAVYTIQKNGTTVGTITISTSGTFTFATTGGTTVTCAASDELSIIAPATPDATLADVRFTVVGTR